MDGLCIHTASYRKWRNWQPRTTATYRGGFPTLTYRGMFATENYAQSTVVQKHPGSFLGRTALDLTVEWPEFSA